MFTFCLCLVCNIVKSVLIPMHLAPINHLLIFSDTKSWSCFTHLIKLSFCIPNNIPTNKQNILQRTLCHTDIRLVVRTQNMHAHIHNHKHLSNQKSNHCLWRTHQQSWWQTHTSIHYANTHYFHVTWLIILSPQGNYFSFSIPFSHSADMQCSTGILNIEVHAKSSE